MIKIQIIVGDSKIKTAIDEKDMNSRLRSPEPASGQSRPSPPDPGHVAAVLADVAAGFGHPSPRQARV